MRSKASQPLLAPASHHFYEGLGPSGLPVLLVVTPQLFQCSIVVPVRTHHSFCLFVARIQTPFSDADNAIQHPWGLGMSPKQWLHGIVTMFYGAAAVVLVGLTVT